MVDHYRRVIEMAARDGIMVDVHEPMHDTGERRTYPNMMSREGARGQEYNAWGGDGGNPPEHETILFFTRLLAGPMDFTPGIFDILLERGTGRPRRLDEPRPRTTLAKQLALYVVLYSPLQMAADLPENYDEPARVPVHPRRRGRLGHHSRARRPDRRLRRRRAAGARRPDLVSWAPSPTNRRERSTCRCRSCTPGKQYVAEIYADGPGANWFDNPLPVTITRRTVTSATQLHIALAPGGGQAIRIRPAR